MERKIRIVSGDTEGTAQLNDTPTAEKIFSALPIRSEARRWGAEIYFSIPVNAPEDDAQQEVPSGTLAYWPPGKSFCIFFGQTPASPVNVVGTLDANPHAWDAVPEGAEIRIEPADM